MSSLWTENIEMPEFPTLEKDIRTQVLIIGGGMAGVLCAYFLQQAGVDYCLLEKDRICQGEMCIRDRLNSERELMKYPNELSQLADRMASDSWQG